MGVDRDRAAGLEASSSASSWGHPQKSAAPPCLRAVVRSEDRFKGVRGAKLEPAKETGEEAGVRAAGRRPAPPGAAASLYKVPAEILSKISSRGEGNSSFHFPSVLQNARRFRTHWTHRLFRIFSCIHSQTSICQEARNNGCYNPSG